MMPTIGHKWLAARGSRYLVFKANVANNWQSEDAMASRLHKIKYWKVLVKLVRDLTRPISPKWWFSKGNPLISGKSRLVKYYNLARKMVLFQGSLDYN